MSSHACSFPHAHGGKPCQLIDFCRAPACLHSPPLHSVKPEFSGISNGLSEISNRGVPGEPRVDLSCCRNAAQAIAVQTNGSSGYSVDRPTLVHGSNGSDIVEEYPVDFPIILEEEETLMDYDGFFRIEEKKDDPGVPPVADSAYSCGDLDEKNSVRWLDELLADTTPVVPTPLCPCPSSKSGNTCSCKEHSEPITVPYKQPVYFQETADFPGGDVSEVDCNKFQQNGMDTAEQIQTPFATENPYKKHEVHVKNRKHISVALDRSRIPRTSNLIVTNISLVIHIIFRPCTVLLLNIQSPHRRTLKRKKKSANHHTERLGNT